MRTIDEESVSFGRGPFSFDVQFALAHGWDLYTIRRTIATLDAITLGQSAALAVRAGMTRICDACECMTYPLKPCHHCENDKKRAEEQRLYLPARVRRLLQSCVSSGDLGGDLRAEVLRLLNEANRAE